MTETTTPGKSGGVGLAGKTSDQTDEDLTTRLNQYVSRIWQKANARYPLQPVSIPQQIAKKVHDDIAGGALAPGEWIREADLADQFGVSRGPVREALHLLHKDGVVELLPRRGARVAEYGPEDIKNIFDIRSVLFGLTARLAAEQSEIKFDGDFRIGRELVIDLLERSEVGVQEFADLKGAICALIAYTGNNNWLIEALERSDQKVVAHNLNYRTNERRENTLQKFESLLLAIENSSVEDAERIAREIVCESRDDIVSQLS